MVCALAGAAVAEPAAPYPVARNLRPLTVPGGYAASVALRFDTDLDHRGTYLHLAVAPTARLELRANADASSTELGLAYAFDDGRGATTAALELTTSFADIPIIAGLHARLRLRELTLRVPPSQLIVLRGDGQTTVIGRLPLAFGLQAASGFAVECEVELASYADELGGMRYAVVDQLQMRTGAWWSLALGGAVYDMGALVDADPLHGSTSAVRYWWVLRRTRAPLWQ